MAMLMMRTAIVVLNESTGILQGLWLIGQTHASTQKSPALSTAPHLSGECSNGL
ncbi:hypothetical protein ACRRTK_020925 [Alexandromys fortis]